MTPTNIVDERRIGSFSIRNEWIRCYPEEVLKLMAGMIVIRCEQMYEIDGFRYTAFGDRFDPMEPGLIANWYDVQEWRGEPDMNGDSKIELRFV